MSVSYKDLLQGQGSRDGHGMAAKWRSEDDLGPTVSNAGVSGKKRQEDVVQHLGGDAREGVELGHDGRWNRDTRGHSEEM